MKIYHYTYLITNLHPAKERYYIGVRSSNIAPSDDNEYMSSSRYIKEAIKINGKDNFEKIVIAEFDNRLDAEEHEIYLHKIHDVAKSSLFYNKARALDNGFTTYGNTEIAEKRAKTVSQIDWPSVVGTQLSVLRNDPNWKNTTGKLAREKQIATLNDPQWKATIGKEQTSKLIAIRNDPTWKKTVGKTKSNKQRKTINNPYWKNSVGKAQIRKQKITKNSKEWKETICAKAKQKELKTKLSDEWKDANTIKCEHCGLSMLGKNNYNRWHGDKCKQRKVNE